MISQAESDSQDRGLSAPQAKEIASPLTQVDPRKHLLTRQVLRENGRQKLSQNRGSLQDTPAFAAASEPLGETIFIGTLTIENKV
jgi:hypothetical protein